ncbi:MAG: NERD domain-containing protein [Vallitaleaceae bacterium]|nr:NERD domain-containing protein [Vallitaleaceae bacterium]MBN2696227.1 NERD domain-containing protein [Bacilli bacterium]
MKRERIFQSIDIVILIWIILLFASAINFRNESVYMLFSLISSGSLSFYYSYVIYLRIKWNKVVDYENKINEKIESKIGSDEDNYYFKVKQEVLENRIEAQLRVLYPNAKIMKNALCPKMDNTTSEIDVLMVSVDGIFLFEAKNLTARITGDWNQEKLIAEYVTGNKIEIQNPVIQNSYHYQYLKKILGINEHSRFKNIVVLGDAVKYEIEEIKKGPTYSSVCRVKDLSKTVKYRSDKTKNIFTEADVEAIFSTVKTYFQSTPERQEKHIDNVAVHRD